MKYLTEQEEKVLLRMIKTVAGSTELVSVGAKAQRDLMIVELILGTGLRAAELVGLNVGDVRNREKLFVRPEIAKRGKGRFVPICSDLQKRLKRFMAWKLTQKEKIRDEAPLFVSRTGDRLSKRSLQETIQGWMVKAELTTSEGGRVVALYGVHSLRHTFAKRMQERGVNLTTIQKLLGHASLSSTGIYTEAGWSELVDAVEVLG